MNEIIPTPGDPQIPLTEKFRELCDRNARINGELPGPPLDKQNPVHETAKVRKSRKIQWCAFPGCKFPIHAGWNPIDSHHVKSRGAGGSDGREHEVPACREHHRGAHSDPRIKAVFELVWLRMGLDFPAGYIPEQCVKEAATPHCGSIT